MIKDCKVPQIRFKGFECQWHKSVLSKILSNISVKNYISVTEPLGLYEVIQQGDNPVAGYSNQSPIDNYESLVIFGDHTLSLYKPQSPFLIASDGVKILFASHFNGNYLYYLLLNNLPTSEGYKRYYSILKNISVSFTTEILEQSKIGKLFQSIDSLITYDKMKHKLLQNIKKSLLRKMFPNDNENLPQIRFKGFDEKWESKRLSAIGETFMGLSSKSKNDFGHGDARYITYMNIFLNPLAKSTLVEQIEIDMKQNEVKYGDIFFTTSSETPDEVGMSSVWVHNMNNTYLNSFCFGVRPYISLKPFFLAYALRSEMFRKQVKLLAQGISRFNISTKNMMNNIIAIPCKNEQSKIGQLFKKLDELIELYNYKTDKLEKIKYALLHKMFS